MFIFLKTKKESSGITVTKIAATFIGTVIGAGFASGQEVLQFFGYYQINGFLGIIVTTILFMVFGYIILKMGWQYQAYSHKEILNKIPGKWLKNILDIVIVFFLFGAFVTMIAGSGAVFEEQFLINSFWGNIFMILISLLTVLSGVGGVVSAISIIVPFLIIGIIFMTVMSFLNAFPPGIGTGRSLISRSPVNNWLISAIVYVSYNIVMAIAILAPLGGEIKEKEKIKPGSILGGLGLGIGAGLIFFTLILNLPDILEYEVPMIYIAGKISPWAKLLYSFILLAEIYTTAVGNLFGFVRRITGNTRDKYQPVTIITGITALIFSQMGFSNLVYYLYPVMGYAGFLMIIGILIRYYKDKKILR
ncbi:MAG: hypothetical protein ACOCP5_04455 [Halanaerobiaceae bacterium]